MVIKGLQLAREWIAAQVNNPTTRVDLPKGHRDKRSPANHPLTSTCKSDAAWDITSKRAGLAWSISGGLIINKRQGSQTESFVSSPIVAEALALRSGLIAAVNLDITRIKMYSDNQTLIQAINFETQAKEIMRIISDIHRISSVFTEIEFLHLLRDLIKDIDQTAKRPYAAHLLFNFAFGLDLGQRPCFKKFILMNHLVHKKKKKKTSLNQ